MRETTTQIILDKRLTEETAGLFESLGLDLTTAIRVFLKKSLCMRGFPFNVRFDTPDEETFISPLKRQQEDVYTYADYLSWNSNQRCELHEGTQVMLPVPTTIHQRVLYAFFLQIGSFLQGTKYEVFPAPFDVRLFQKDSDRPEDVNTVVQPDISVICDPDKIDRAGCKGAPDFIIEILSPSTANTDRQYKFDLYRRAGVREYWVVDPDLRCVLVHILEDGKYHASLIYLSRAKVPVNVLDGCEIDLSLVFPES